MIDAKAENAKISHLYDSIMMFVIVISLVPLAFKNQYFLFKGIEYITTFIFITDYLLRLLTADCKLKIKQPLAMIIYPFTPMAIIDLIVILSSFSFLSSGFRVLKVLRLTRTLRVFRAMKFLRYSKNLLIIINVLKKKKRLYPQLQH